MREILFRGKVDVDPEWLEEMELTLEQYVTQHIPSADFKDGWVYGYLADGYIIGEAVDVAEDYFAPEFWMPVKKETVSQYTGLKDKNGIRIFAGDIVRWTDDPPFDNWSVAQVIWGGKWDYPAFDLEPNPDWDSNALSHIFNAGGYEIEVIGNIHDNPELLHE